MPGPKCTDKADDGLIIDAEPAAQSTGRDIRVIGVRVDTVRIDQFALNAARQQLVGQHLADDHYERRTIQIEHLEPQGRLLVSQHLAPVRLIHTSDPLYSSTGVPAVFVQARQRRC